jgi:hypothetical protein
VARGRSVVPGKHGGRLLREMFNRVGSRNLPPILDLATETARGRVRRLTVGPPAALLPLFTQR